MLELWNSLVQLFDALLNLVASVGVLLFPLLPLAVWVAFWLFAVNWRKLSRVLLQGGWVGLALIAVMTILVWGLIDPPPEGSHYILGLTLSNFVGKTVYVTTLACIMLLCGSVQLTGAVDRWCDFARFETPVEEHAEHGHGDHGHDAHGGGAHVAHAQEGHG